MAAEKKEQRRSFVQRDFSGCFLVWCGSERTLEEEGRSAESERAIGVVDVREMAWFSCEQADGRGFRFRLLRYCFLVFGASRNCTACRAWDGEGWLKKTYLD